MDTFRWGSGGTSLGEWEHNNNKPENHCYLVEEAEVRTCVPFVFNLFFFSNYCKAENQLWHWNIGVQLTVSIPRFQFLDFYNILPYRITCRTINHYRFNLNFLLQPKARVTFVSYFTTCKIMISDTDTLILQALKLHLGKHDSIIKITLQLCNNDYLHTITQ